MRKHKNEIELELSASDLSNYIACDHITFSDLGVAYGIREQPNRQRNVYSAAFSTIQLILALATEFIPL